MVKVAVAGATGYSGQELVRLLLRHPEVELTAVTSEQYAGQSLNDVYPHLGRGAAVPLVPLTADALLADSDVVFTALPHGVPMGLARQIVGAGKKLVDFGADFRLKDTAAYEAFYKLEHTEPELLAEAVYGLPELWRDEIRGARLVANPGCYATAATLALAPLVEAGWVDLGSLIIDAKSGVSGAGRGLSLGVHFGEVNENFKAYNIAGRHRHTPEIEQSLGRLADEPVALSFTPHLVPMTRGIMATCYARLGRDATKETVHALYEEWYGGEPFIDVCAPGVLPETKQVSGSNMCRIGVAVDERLGRVTVISVIDNLVKGAAGQALQNFNLICGLPETLGLTGLPLYP